jgi:hypothetical protein
MSGSSRRIRREKKTVSIMIGMYCRAHRHGHRDTLCADCAKLHDYAIQRIDKCPYCLAKPTCANCTIHCYRPDLRERIREVMRYAGPRMMGRHPVLALLHRLDGLRRVQAPAHGRRPTAG